MQEALAGLTTEQIRLLLSEWAERKRYLPPELTNLPGKWDNSIAPYLVQIMDMLAPSNPARKVAVRKGGQICASTGLLENFIGYTIDHNPGGMIYISADKELTKQGMTLKVDRMLFHSNLTHLLSAPDGKSKRSGDTSVLKEFPNGFLLGVGARNPGKLRQTSAKYAALDEVDGMPLILGGVGQEEGNPITIINKRTDAYIDTRKILYLSTPLKMQTSLIQKLFLLGDQRFYFVPCVHCEFMQILEWRGMNDSGKPYGFTWELDDDGILIEESVAYVCRNCGALFYNHDKSYFLKPENGAEWRPTARPQEKGFVSYHLPAFYSPPGLYHWKGSVYKWLNAWDVKNNRVKDREEYQAFRNLEAGLPWEEFGESPTADRVREHRRAIYTSGEIPNSYITKETGAPAILLTCAVDVHGDRLDVEVVAWCQNRQTYSVHWLHFMGDPADSSETSPWIPLARLIEEGEWVADDGRHYAISVTLIDVGWAEKADAVYQFAQGYSSGVYPVMGRKFPIKGSLIREFQESTSATGNLLYNVTATLYKDRITAWLKGEWAEHQLQPLGYPNYPQDYRDDFFKQYEAEEKVEVYNARTGQRIGWEWRQVGNRPNHAFDVRVYNMAGFDMLVADVCMNHLELLKLDYDAFFNYATPLKNPAGKWLESPYSFHPDEVAANS